MRETDRRRLLFLFLLVLGGIAILSGGITSLRFQPGRAFPPQLPPRPPDMGDTGRELQPAWLPEALQRLIHGTVILAGAVTVIGAIVSSRFRRFLLRQIPALLVIGALLVLFLALFHPDRSPAPRPAPPAAPSQPARASGPEYTPPAVNPPGWSVVLIALGAAAGLVGLGLAAWWRFRPAAAPAPRDVLSELGREAGAAAARIRRGGAPRDVVLRAYKEMCDILAPRATDLDYITAREFARRLRAHGMQNEHVDRLTRIFEEVRYGHRSGARLAADAVACLEEIRDAYARG